MKKIARPLLFAATAWTLLVQTGCYGSFSLTKKLYNWNGDVVDNKFVQSLLFWVLNIIPVYWAAALVDVVIFNLIEFWSGENPISMKEGEYQQQLVTRDGIQYRMEATRNQLTIVPLNGRNEGKMTKLVFTPGNTSWNVEKDGKLITLAKVSLGDQNIAQIGYRTVVLPENAEQLAAARNARFLDLATR